MNEVLKKIQLWGSLVTFSHSIFALPFALSMAVILNKSYPLTLVKFFAVILCMITARTAAMAFNRIVDRDIDAKNPRTAVREIPQGKVSVKSAYFIVAISILLFHFGALILGVHCLYLAPIVIGVLLSYSYLKRFTSTAHFFLGFCLALAPGGVWYAMTATWSWIPVPLMVAVLLWVGGFDIIYSCQDAAFDNTEGLHSLPSKLGIRRALIISKSAHILSVLFMVLFGKVMECGSYYYIGVFLFSLLLISQHRLVSPKDLSKVDKAFFTRNGFASVLFFIFVTIDSGILS